ncbi:hypothetical protein HNQ71_006721 [Mesorhizobium sangaii]|uniref:Uncharacterized protein n=1 Tax=Mesorhizobium sangaii TaxID=505389 RepID=A0A841PVC2_9HYPH|nr:hypothetical protein [Mesorhizobium sangaii]
MSIRCFGATLYFTNVNAHAGDVADQSWLDGDGMNGHLAGQLTAIAFPPRPSRTLLVPPSLPFSLRLSRRCCWSAALPYPYETTRRRDQALLGGFIVRRRRAAISGISMSAWNRLPARGIGSGPPSIRTGMCWTRSSTSAAMLRLPSAYCLAAESRAAPSRGMIIDKPRSYGRKGPGGAASRASLGQWT